MIYLYVKTHNVTGLKYLGKTARSNPEKYKGSGKYWRRHLKKHGNFVTTEIIGKFYNEYEASKFALQYSKDNNVVQSPDWANLKEENGLDGSPKGVKFSKEHKKKLSIAQTGKCYNPFTGETRQKMSKASKKKVDKQIAEGRNIFVGEIGSKFASERNKKLIDENRHNFQKSTVAVDKKGNRVTISTELFWSQTGLKEDWEYVHHTSNIGKQRLNTAKGDI